MRALKHQDLIVRCVECGKNTLWGRLPRNTSRDVGDGSFRYPRRHSVNGQVCPGSFAEGDWLSSDDI